ncbi:calreticulin [Microcaecilia unicolor]|uniref:Calreticulin n=1 Tax=Microcaecilia unicolor TaxID=1415580 RepID=A0A6P7YG30_9AMPH|nr:calreticulin-like [Microcaecilia unicolor]
MTARPCSMKWLMLAALVAAGRAEPLQYFKEQFEDGDEWQKRWIESKHKSDFGKFQLSAGNFYGDEEKDKGLQTSQDARYYALSARFEPFCNEDQTLVIQFTVKHQQNIDCGGGYVKLFPSDLNQEDMHGDSTYYIMFGPDICGSGMKKVHVIFNYKEKNHLIKKDIRCKDDEYSHLYTLIVRPDNTYEVKIDNQKVESGSLEEDWDMLPPKKIKDPDAKQPDDWDEREKIDDPEDKKPEDWEDAELIPDPEAKKPDDWDDEMDGEWESPMIVNSNYKGEWKPTVIDNPNFKGPWIHPEIDNPEYIAEANVYRFDNIGVIGLDLWQVKSGTVFDNFLITNDEQFAEEFGNETWGVTKDGEQKMKEKQDEDEKKKQEAEEKKTKTKEKDEKNEDETTEQEKEEGKEEEHEEGADEEEHEEGADEEEHEEGADEEHTYEEAGEEGDESTLKDEL